MVHVEVNCPYCRKTLMDDEHQIKDHLSVALWGKVSGAEGIIRLSAYYGDYQVETSLVIPSGMVVEFQCPFCRHTLASSRPCDACNSPMVALEFPNGGRVQFCSKRGCTKHLIEFEDPEAELRAFYHDNLPYME